MKSDNVLSRKKRQCPNTIKIGCHASPKFKKSVYENSQKQWFVDI